MPLSDHYKGGLTERLLVRILTSDPSTGRIEVVGKDAAVIQVDVNPVPTVFRWPIQEEIWTIVRTNGFWALESLVPNPDDKSINSLDPGEALVQATTIWTPDGERMIRTGDVAGGVLSGTYPNPGFAVDMATQVELDALDTRLDALEPHPRDAVTLTNGLQALGAGQVSLSRWMTGGGSAFLSGDSSSIGPDGWFNWQASEWAIPGKTTKWLINGQVYHNSIAPGTITFSVGVRKYTIGGASGTLTWTMVTGDPDARIVNIVNPTGGAGRAVPTIVTPGSDGHYGCYQNNTATTATGSLTVMRVRVYVVWE